MPHFIIDCSENILTLRSAEEIMDTVYHAAESTGLFAEGDIKVRIHPYNYYKLGKTKKDFIHVFGNIMQGRTDEQKAALSKKIIEAMNRILPGISILSINIRDFEKASYFNKSML